MNTRLFDLAKTIRSKNAGVDRITFDVIFNDRANYDRVRRSGVLSREAICRIFGIAPDRITDCVEFEPALAIKFTIRRTRPEAAALATATSSAASRTGRCSIWKSRPEASNAASLSGMLPRSSSFVRSPPDTRSPRATSWPPCGSSQASFGLIDDGPWHGARPRYQPPLTLPPTG